MKLHSVKLPTGSSNTDEIIEWCKEHIGKPFEMSDEPNFIGFDYHKGLWGCYQGYNRFNVGYDSPDLRDNWVFKNEKDATWFAWRWL